MNFIHNLLNFKNDTHQQQQRQQQHQQHQHPVTLAYKHMCDNNTNTNKHK